MKQFLNFFYITPFKTFLAIIICLSCLGVSNEIVNVAKLYKEDSASVSNSFVQGKNYDYYTSEHLKKEIESTIQNVMSYCFMLTREEESNGTSSDEYIISTITYLAESYVEDKTVDEYFINSGFITLTEKPRSSSNTVEIDGKYYVQSVDKEKIRLKFKQQKGTLIEKYRMYTDEEYRRTVTSLNSIEGLHYAVVNHSKGIIISDIDEINGKTSRENVRKYFKGNEKNLLIVRSVHNPYFEKGTMTEYVDCVNELAEKYEDNFDIYISFNEDLIFPTSPEEYAERHQNAYKNISEHFYHFIMILSINIIFTLFLLKVTGKRQHKGKTVLVTADKIPNEIILIPLIIIFISMLALYQLSIYMGIKPEDAYFFNVSSDMYMLRGHGCAFIMEITLLSLLTTIKRQSDNKSLFTNTYLYQFIKLFRKNKDRYQAE